MRKRGTPRRQELVICRITKINPNSAYAEMVEYRKEGLIHVSEVAKKWVRDIREFLKENQYVVCRVMGLEDHTISLSIKRVSRSEQTHALNEFKRENKAEKMLEQVAKLLKKDLDQAYQEVGYDLQDSFGNLTKVFEAALKHPDQLDRKGVPKKWAEAIIEIAKKRFVEKIYTVKGRLKLVCYKPDGIKVIRDVIKNSSNGLEVRYVSAPDYEVVGTGKNIKQLEKKVQEAGAAMVKAIESQNGEGEFQLLK